MRIVPAATKELNWQYSTVVGKTTQSRPTSRAQNSVNTLPFLSIIFKAYILFQQARLERWIGGLYDWSGQRWLWGATGQPMNFLGFGELSEGRLREWHCVYMDPEQGHKWNHKLCTR